MNTWATAKTNRTAHSFVADENGFHAVCRSSIRREAGTSMHEFDSNRVNIKCTKCVSIVAEAAPVRYEVATGTPGGFMRGFGTGR